MPHPSLRAVWTPDDTRALREYAAAFTGEPVDPAVGYIDHGELVTQPVLSRRRRKQYQRPRTRLGRTIARILGAWWIWTTLTGLILGTALYLLATR